MGRATPTPRPSKVPSFKNPSRTAFNTGECSAAQSIFLWPSGAGAGSLTIDSCIASSAFLSTLYHLLGGLDLFPAAEHEGANEDEQQERDEYDPDAQTHGGGAAEREEQSDDGAADAADPDQDVADNLEPGGRDLFGIHDLRPEEPPPLDAREEGEQE